MMKCLPTQLLRATLLLLLLLLPNCVTIPETGRRSLQLMPESQLASMATEQFATMQSELTVSTDTALHDRIATIGRRVVAASDTQLPAEEWEFVVFEDEAANAFAMPGGKVGFFTGLINMAASDDELAIVMGHEIAHVNLRHGNERVSQALLVTAAALGAQIAAKDEDRHTREAIMLALGLGSQLGILLPYSRIHESESDQIGLLYAARAGYDPRAAIPFWQRMEEQADGRQPPAFLSTHPAHENRIRELNRFMPDALEAYQRTANPAQP